MKYCESAHQTVRRKTREVKVGPVGIGGGNPIRIQSMTTSNTRDVEATVEQAIRLADAGCEIVRVTVQGMKEAEACQVIKSRLLQKGYEVPLVADIHFYPPAAMKVVEFVDKVRINPGNFVDKRAQFKKQEYDDATYREELVKIEEGFAPLVQKCKQLNKAMRIGVNHGSLSDRIMNRYGDTPSGMVESALEFARVCRKYDFHDMVFSMKASNPIVMVQAYRLLVAEMYKLDWDYPLHLGVTEAGEGEDGRIKSAVGIGSLLLDGLGDTIRVSLTEDPWQEIDPCRRLVSFAREYENRGSFPFVEMFRNVQQITKRKVVTSSKLHRSGTVMVNIEEADLLSSDLLDKLGCSEQFGKPVKGMLSPDILYIESCPHDPKARERLTALGQAQIAVISKEEIEMLPSSIPLRKVHERASGSFAVEVSWADEWSAIKKMPVQPEFVLFSPKGSRLHETRAFIDFLNREGLHVPVLLKFDYSGPLEDDVIKASAECGALLSDGLGEGIFLGTGHPLKDRISFSFALLQAVRKRTVKTDFISCPGCGRTLFDLQSVSRRIRERTSHLPGVKIAIMGCIVNGPGEMADADFGYVGSRPGKIDLYVGKECVEKNIDFDEADERLISLIKAHGRWQEPANTPAKVGV